MKIGLDLDDVLMDFNGGLFAFCRAQYGASYMREDISSYFLEEVWGVSREEAGKRVSEFYVSGEHKLTQPVAGAVETIDELRTQHELVIITARPKGVDASTRDWLQQHFPFLLDSLFYAEHPLHLHQEGQRGVGTKGEICKRLGVEVFVDDAPHHIEDTAPVVTHALIFDAPWNRSHSSTHSNARRVKSWEEIRHFINTIH